MYPLAMIQNAFKLCAQASCKLCGEEFSGAVSLYRHLHHEHDGKYECLYDTSEKSWRSTGFETQTNWTTGRKDDDRPSPRASPNLCPPRTQCNEQIEDSGSNSFPHVDLPSGGQLHCANTKIAPNTSQEDPTSFEQRRSFGLQVSSTLHIGHAVFPISKSSATSSGSRASSSRIGSDSFAPIQSQEANKVFQAVNNAHGRSKIMHELQRTVRNSGFRKRGGNFQDQKWKGKENGSSPKISKGKENYRNAEGSESNRGGQCRLRLKRKQPVLKEAAITTKRLRMWM